MATAESIAIRLEVALARLKAAAGQIAAYTGVASPDLPDWSRNPDELRAEQLETIAKWAGEIAQYAQGLTIIIPSISDEQPDQQVAVSFSPNYAELTRDELEELITARGIDMSGASGSGTNGAIIKHDLVMALEADDAAIHDEKDMP